MKTLLFAIAVLVLGVSISEARSPKWMCLAYCGPVASDTCGWIVRRTKRTACLKRLVRQCQR